MIIINNEGIPDMLRRGSTGGAPTGHNGLRTRQTVHSKSTSKQ